MSQVLFQAKDNLGMDNKRKKLLREMGGPSVETSQFIDKSGKPTLTEIGKTGPKDNSRSKTAEPQKNSGTATPARQGSKGTGNNLAKLLFGTKERSESVKRERMSVEKSTLENIVLNSTSGAQSSGSPTRQTPKVTMTTRGGQPLKQNLINLQGSGNVRNEKLGSTNGLGRTNSVKSINSNDNNQVAKTGDRALVLVRKNTGGDQNMSNISDPKKRIIRTKIVSKMDETLTKQLVPVPKPNTFTDGASLKDNRRVKMIENQREATKIWEDFFGLHLLEVRWDLFEDFLYLNTEMSLGKYIDLVQFSNWDAFFMHWYKTLGKLCTSNENFKEIPEIPFSQTDLVYKGRTVRKADWVSAMEK